MPWITENTQTEAIDEYFKASRRKGVFHSQCPNSHQELEYTSQRRNKPQNHQTIEWSKTHVHIACDVTECHIKSVAHTQIPPTSAQFIVIPLHFRFIAIGGVAVNSHFGDAVCNMFDRVSHRVAQQNAKTASAVSTTANKLVAANHSFRPVVIGSKCLCLHFPAAARHKFSSSIHTRIN